MSFADALFHVIGIFAIVYCMWQIVTSLDVKPRLIG
jgi:hypothetical protein